MNKKKDTSLHTSFELFKILNYPAPRVKGRKNNYELYIKCF